ncbi:MAG: class I SAM-dependent methyltransferase [Gammaproteobacteria bacterium]|nr:class I SAM-dependent methyltransferase [Gammaproteobacteria bacterium]
MPKYSHNFYKDKPQETFYPANTIIQAVLDILPEIHSVVDFGCGVGAWLAAIKDRGIDNIQGFDGPWVDQNLLTIPLENFKRTDLSQEILLDQKYDLAISLEVAEHLPETSARTFVKSITNASDFVLFSAAIPLQGGTHHVNEQWQDYWASLFKEHNYETIDLIRAQIWDDEKIPYWYKQNILMFVKQERLADLKIHHPDSSTSKLPLRLVHPDIYLSKINKMNTIKGSMKSFRRAIKKILGFS